MSACSPRSTPLAPLLIGQALFGLGLPSLALALAACSDQKAPHQDPAGQEQPKTPPVLQHDFGSIPHGEAREHLFEVDVVGELGPGWRVLNVSVDCSCAKALMYLRSADGSQEQVPVMRAEAMPVIEPGQQLLVRVQIDTATKEPVDFGPADSFATLVVQRVDATTGLGSQRLFWPLRFRFAVDAPVTVRPFAVLDFERVALATDKTLTLALGSDLPDRPIRFGPVHCKDPRLSIELQPQPDGTTLRAHFTPDESAPLGGFRELLVIDTDLESGYQVKLAAVGKVTPNLEASPMAKLSLSTDLGKPQAEDDPRVKGQFVTVRDHDIRRPAEFVVARLVDGAGKDASAWFEVRFEAVPGDDRSRRVRVRYLGGSPGEFRGQLVLAKDRDNGPFLPIELVALHTKSP